MEIGVSYGSLINFPTLLFENQAKKVVEYCLKQGCFFQGLPFRQFHKLNIQCRYVEEPWPGIKYINKTWRWTEEVTARDKVLFTSPPLAREWLREQVFGEATKVDHSFEGKLVEIHKGLGDVNDILDKINNSSNLVLDTYHFRQLEWYTPGLLSGLVPKTKLVHVQPLRKDAEWDQFIRGNETELESMLRRIRELGYDGDFIIETTPFFHNRGRHDMAEQLSSPTSLIENLWAFGTRLRKVLQA